MQNTVTVSVHLTADAFRKFAFYDSFRMKRRWVSPAVFTGIMLAFSLVCLLSGRPGSIFLGSVLLIVGLGVPAVWFGTYFSQLNAQIKAMGLDKKDSIPVYTLRMTKEDIRIRNDRKPEPEQILRWDRVPGIWRGKDAWYLYVAQSKAFIMPDGCYGLEPMELLEYLKAHLPEERIHAKEK